MACAGCSCRRWSQLARRQYSRQSVMQGACELPNGDLLLVTEFMEGGDLHSALRRGAVSWRRRCDCVAAMWLGAEFAVCAVCFHWSCGQAAA